MVVIGASLAGLRGAEALRVNGYRGRLTIVGDEPWAPYDRPPLSKHVLAGETPADGTALPVLERLDAEWRLGQAAVGLDRAERAIRLADGATVGFEKLLIATGVRARPLPGAPRDALAGVFTLRRRDDAAALADALAKRPRRVLIVGAGLIGCEAASCCRSLGLEVTLVDPNPTPLARALGTTIGATVMTLAKEAGVDFRPCERVAALDGDASGHVRAARLVSSGTVEAETVIVALGAARDCDWLARAGLMADDGGVTCDAACRALSADGEPTDDVYAAGDVARWPIALYGGRMISVEHWGNAVEQAAHAARNMLAAPGDQRDYTHLPAFWSSQFGVNIKSVGLVEGADSVAVVQGSRASRRFLAVYGREGRSIAAASFDQARWLPAYAERIEAGAPFPPILGSTDQPRVETLSPGLPQRRARPTAETAHV